MVYFAAFRVNITLVCGVSFGEPTDYAHAWGPHLTIGRPFEHCWDRLALAY